MNWERDWKLVVGLILIIIAIVGKLWQISVG